MCAVNRTSAEPPGHAMCAWWSAVNCPFLSRPHMVRREDAAFNSSLQGSAAITRNPGCVGVWVTGTYLPFRVPVTAAPTGWLIEMGPPYRVEWYCEGRPATRAEIETSIDSGMPFLAAACEQEPTPARRADARLALAAARSAVAALLPMDAPC